MRTASSSAFLVSALLASVLGLSCGPAGISSGNDGVGAPLGTQCAASRVTSVPGAGPLRVTGTTDVQITGEQTGLGQAMGIDVLAPEFANQSPPLETLIEVGADGSLADSGGRFTLTDRCLVVVSDETGDANPVFNPFALEALSQGFFGAPTELRGTCAEGQIPIGLEGIGDTSGSHICVESDIASCVSCGQTSTRWTQDVRFSMTFRALGSLQDVAAFDPINNETTRVDIRADDRVTFEFELIVVYEPVP